MVSGLWGHITITSFYTGMDKTCLYTSSSYLRVAGTPTRFGLLEKKQSQWQKSSDDSRLNNYGTSYSTSYLDPPPEARVQMRFANLRETSTKTNPVNLVHRDYVSRHNKFIQTPEFFKPPPGQAQCPVGDRVKTSRPDLVGHLRAQEQDARNEYAL